MRCAACEQLNRTGPHGEAHSALLPDDPLRKLRPMFKTPVRIAHYRCAECGTWWLHETNPRSEADSGWILIGKEKSLLVPQCE
ncbi:hypothetical protein G3N92_23675 [Burkholderia sp. Ac-20379]|nr:hypothetical protein [Burkholderia sp. Ac-20379]